MLFSRARSSLTGLAVAALAAATVFGAPPPPGDPAAEPSSLTRAPAAIWRLDSETAYQDPSGIILEESTRFRGTMAMSFRPAFSGHPGVYTIDRINWLVTVSNQTEDVYVTGYGTYQVTSSVGMLPVFGHRMMVDVRWGSDQNRRRFDSGLVPMAIPVDGSPIDLELHEVPVPEFDPIGPPPPDPGLGGGAPAPRPSGATLRIATTPVGARDYQVYDLHERGSGFSFGCYEPCRCAIFSQSMGGGFALVPLTGEGQGGPGPLGTQEWAMVDINVITPPRPLRPVGHQERFNRRFTGDGIYQWSPILTPVEGARPQQRLRARLTDSDQPPVEPRDERFDSGRVPVEVQWPRLEIAIADNDYVCLNRVLHISAKPGTRRPIMLPAPQPLPSPIPVPPPNPPLR